jgi:hypothetical protein
MGAIFSGVDGATGLPLPGAESSRDFALRIDEELLHPTTLRGYRWRLQRYGEDDPERFPIDRVNEKDLASAGWGVIYSSDINEDVCAKLKPLLERRKAQAGKLFKTYIFRDGQSKLDFLNDSKACFGPVDPAKIPYFLLIVGSPEKIPFRFQCELDVEYAVGRLYFDDVEDYGHYVRNLINLEEGAARLPSRDVKLFSAQTDPVSERMYTEMVDPLARDLKGRHEGWDIRVVTGKSATRDQLGRLMGGEDTPGFLVSASHGVRFSSGSERQLTDQGGLVCAGDGSGEGALLTREQYFTGADVVDGRSLLGSVAFLFACYSAGTPAFSNYREKDLGRLPQIAPRSFVAALAQRLLGRPGGALAVLGHVDRVWTSNFSWSDAGQIQTLRSLVSEILDGNPIGNAMEHINHRHAAFAVRFSELAQDKDTLIRINPDEYARVWREMNDSRNFVILGDPAVRLRTR